MGENLLVGVIVGVVLFLAGRSLCRTVTGKGGGCGCAGGQCYVIDGSSRNGRTGAPQGAPNRTGCRSCCGGGSPNGIGKEK